MNAITAKITQVDGRFINIVKGIAITRRVDSYNFGDADHHKLEIEPDHMTALSEVAGDNYDLCHTFIKFAGDDQGYFGTCYEDGCLIVREVASIRDAIAGYAD